MSAFSLYHWALHAVDQRAVPIRDLGFREDRIETDAEGDFSGSVRSMLRWCRINESLVIERHGQGARVYAGFERLSRVKPVLGRYRRLARSVKRLTVMGEHDAELGLAARVVDVAGSPLAREWFLVIDAPTYKTLLVARDLDGFGPTGPLQGRRFRGLTWHDGALVNAAADALERVASTSRPRAHALRAPRAR